MQPYPEETNTGISEDCLYLNIFVPEDTAADAKLAVFFYIFGGAFFKNSGDDEMYGPDFLIQHDIIVVTINYRLNIFGHLTLNTPEISGNQAVKDQHLALKWIYENVEHFGGDAEGITVSGHSSGAISAIHQALSPQSSPYISSVVLMGAYATGLCNGWKQLDYSADMLQRSNTSSIGELVPFLMTAPAEVILELGNPMVYHLPYGMYWMPTIERNIFEMNLRGFFETLRG